MYWIISVGCGMGVITVSCEGHRQERAGPQDWRVLCGYQGF